MQLDIAYRPAMNAPALMEPDLIERAKRDPAAFGILYRNHYAMMARYILRRVGDAHVAEDLTAEVFLTALRYLPRYRQRGLPLRVWLYRIAANGVNRWVRRRRWQQRMGALLGTRDEPAAKPETPSGELDAKRARQAMLELPDKYQMVVSLHYLEGLSLAEVAATVGCRIGTVKSRLARGREAMRQALERAARQDAARGRQMP